MVYSYRFLSCPRCHKQYGIQILSIMLIVGTVTGLGSPLFKCISCGAVFDSGKSEWLQMSRWQKIHYVILSIFYSLALGLILALSPVEIISWILYPSETRFLPMPLYLFGLLICALFVLGFQLFRVILSIKRIRSNIRKPMDISYWTWQTNPQGFWEAVCTVNLLLFCFIAYFRGAI